jgi:hypothetical protein
MPLVVLGIIVVVGAGLMIYYQIGPTLKNRVRNGGGAPVSRSRTSSSPRDSFGGYLHMEGGSDSDSDFDADSDSGYGEEKPYEKSKDGKVLYVFNGGKTEIRPLGEKPDAGRDDSKDGPRGGTGDDPTDSDDGDVG